MSQYQDESITTSVFTEVDLWVWTWTARFINSLQYWTQWPKL